MFNHEFYPTPKHVVMQMIGKLDLKGKSILEPSAGKGDILEVIRDSFDRYDKPKMYAIEREPELKAILHDKNFRVISDDFLNYSGGYYFDFIIMNPPFSNGDQHLLKAWEVIQDGQIICLLNSETINNPYSQSRQLLANIIQEHGEVEHIGAVFTDAQRQTAVKCCIVRLTKKADESPLNFQFGDLKENKKRLDLNDEILQNPLATRDIIGNMEKQYNDLQGAYVEYIKAVKRLKHFAVDLIDTQYTDVKKIADECFDKKGNNRASFNNFVDATKQHIWRDVITRTNIEKYMTASVKENFRKFSEQQGYMDFNKENVASLVAMVFGNRHNIMKQAITDVFTNFTKYHEENRCHVEGWKTNDKYKVNRKIILPYYIKFDESWYKQWGEKFDINYSHREKLSDIDRVMCYISGENYEELRDLKEMSTLENSLKHRFDQIGKIRPGDKVELSGESKFFTFKFWRKGTLHIEFKDAWLWQEFNMRACDGLNWLPEEDKRNWKDTNKQKKDAPKTDKTTATAKNQSMQLLFEITNF